MQTNSITAVVLACNEEKNLPACLDSLAGFCPVLLVDSGSTDRTVEIAGQYGVGIIYHEYENHAGQLQWAISNLPIDSEWIFAVDADYVITRELKQKLLAELDSVPGSVEGIYIRHRYVFHDSPIRFGGIRHDRLQIVRNGMASVDTSDLVDCRFRVAGPTLKWKEMFYESNRYDDDISTWLEKQDKFSLRLAVEDEMRRQGLLAWQVKPAFFGTPDQHVTWLREQWRKLPLYLRPVLYFVYRYVFALGFLDGKGGFLYHLLQGLVMRILVDWKIGQLRKAGILGETLRAFSEQMLKTRDGSVDRILQSMNSQNSG